MGRRKRKNQFMKKLKAILITIIITIIVILAKKYGYIDKIDNAIRQTGLSNTVNQYKNTTLVPLSIKTDNEIINSVANEIKIYDNKLNILFLDVGQADCTLVICNGKTLLIDAGNKDDGEKIVSCLKALNISKLDYVVGTHVHEDHLGGMSYIVDAFDIGTFYMPYDSKTTSSYYKRLLKSLMNKSYSITEVNVGDKFNLGDATIEIMTVDNSEPDNINEQSITLELSYGSQKYLFMADAEKANETSRTWNDVDLLKVGHHGSNGSSSQNFLNQVLPEIAIISVGDDNSYLLPKDKVIDRLNKLGSKIYRTDLDGTIQVVSDGNINEIIKINISFNGEG